MNFLIILVMSLFGLMAPAESGTSLIQVSPFVVSTQGVSVRSEAKPAEEMNPLRYCGDDGACRPGVEQCVGHMCQPMGGLPHACFNDSQCIPRHCIQGFCH